MAKHYLDEGRVAEIVSHHDGRVQGGEVERGDGHVVVAALRLNDRRALEVLLASLKRNQGVRISDSRPS